MPGPTLDARFAGMLLGLALGDACGAPHEGGPLERGVWVLIGRTRDGKRRWTDDTTMALDVAESLAAHGRIDQDDLAARFARSHRWSRGYGPGATRLLKRVRRGGDWRTLSVQVFPGGSFGNGGAMRAPVIGAFHWNVPERRRDAVREATCVTHAHPLGIEGAAIIAEATAAAMAGGNAMTILDAAMAVAVSTPFRTRFDVARRWLADGDSPSCREVARALGNGIAATDSCVTAVHLATRFLDDDVRMLHRFVAGCGGDADTLGAMAGAIRGAARGVQTLPESLLDRLEAVPRLRAAARGLHDAAAGAI